MGAHANFSVVLDRRDRLVLKDEGPWDRHCTITNDVDWVVSQVAKRLNGRALFYFDSEAELTRVLVVAGKFAGWLPC